MTLDRSFDGRSPGLRISASHLPSREFSQWHDAFSRHEDERQSAYSCGGSHGLGPCWVVLTVFPINPLGVIARGTVGGELASGIEARQGETDGVLRFTVDSRFALKTG